MLVRGSHMPSTNILSLGPKSTMQSIIQLIPAGMLHQVNLTLPSVYLITLCFKELYNLSDMSTKLGL